MAAMAASIAVTRTTGAGGSMRRNRRRGAGHGGILVWVCMVRRWRAGRGHGGELVLLLQLVMTRGIWSRVRIVVIAVVGRQLVR